MAVVISTLSVAFAAFCVWLAVRIVNRRERWAKWMFAALVGLPLLYVLSFGPWCWISCRMNSQRRAVFFVPITWTFGDPTKEATPFVGQVFQQYAKLGSRSSWSWRAVVNQDNLILYWLWDGLPAN